MDQMSEAVEPRHPLIRRLTGESWWHSLQATSTRRALLLTALGGLLIAGIITALPTRGDDGNRLAGYINANPLPSTGTRGDETFNSAHAGDCLNWPNKSPDQAVIVNCAGDHRFEVAESVDMRTFPGSEYGTGAAPPSTARIQQISQEQCGASVRHYLGTHFDPNSKFTVSMLWSGDRAWSQSGERRMLCGLELPGPNNEQIVFKGRVAELDQSKVWPEGTCIGIDSGTNQPNDVPVDCLGPHAMEVTGAVNLADKFPGPLPSEADQDSFIKDSCTKMTDDYLAPVALRTTTLTLLWSTISLPSWTAGSHQVACSVGATLGNGGWATLVGSAKGQLLINGQPPIPLPDIPDGRLVLPPIPMDIPSPATQASQGSQGSQSQVDSANLPTGTQHLPNAPGPQTPMPQTTNTFLGTPPPPPPEQPPMDQVDQGPAGPGPAGPAGPAAPPPAPGGPAAPPPAPGGPAAPPPPPSGDAGPPPGA
jgi:Septum formation